MVEIFGIVISLAIILFYIYNRKIADNKIKFDLLEDR